MQIEFRTFAEDDHGKYPDVELKIIIINAIETKRNYLLYMTKK